MQVGASGIASAFSTCIPAGREERVRWSCPCSVRCRHRWAGSSPGCVIGTQRDVPIKVSAADTGFRSSGTLLAAYEHSFSCSGLSVFPFAAQSPPGWKLLGHSP